MRSRTAWLGLAAGAYVAAAVALFPAATAYRWLAPPSFRATGIEGSLWRGRAALASVAGLGFYDLQWALDPLSVLSGAIRLDLEAHQPGGFISGSMRAALGSVELADLRATTSLATLATLVPLGDVQGLVSVQLERLELRDGWPVSAVGQIRLGQLEAPLLTPGGPSELIPLGDFLVTLTDEDAAALSGRFEDRDGPLEVAGTFRLTPDRGYVLEGLVRPRDDAPEEIVRALQFLTGAPDQAGRRRFELTGSL